MKFYMRLIIASIAIMSLCCACGQCNMRDLQNEIVHEKNATTRTKTLDPILELIDKVYQERRDLMSTAWDLAPTGKQRGSTVANTKSEPVNTPPGNGGDESKTTADSKENIRRESNDDSTVQTEILSKQTNNEPAEFVSINVPDLKQTTQAPTFHETSTVSPRKKHEDIEKQKLLRLFLSLNGLR